VARQVWNVVVRLGSEGYGVVKQGRCGSAWFCAMRYGMVWSGQAGGARHGSMRFDNVWSVMARQVAHGVER
jgi:hypothetical protein